MDRLSSSEDESADTDPSTEPSRVLFSCVGFDCGSELDDIDRSRDFLIDLDWVFWDVAEDDSLRPELELIERCLRCDDTSEVLYRLSLAEQRYPELPY